jgi:D-3-phosphoglycerate dehydrogenase
MGKIGLAEFAMKGKIAVTPRSITLSGHPALEELRQAGYEVIFPTPGKQPGIDELKEFLPSCVGYLAGVEPIPAEVLKMCPDLRVISRNGIGVDNIDLVAAKELGIIVENAGDANSRGVAELTISLMLAGLRHITWSDRRLKQGEWLRQKGIEIRGRTLGVIGCGQIGKQVVEMALGLGMLVQAHDLFPDPSFTPKGDFRYVELDQLLGTSDVISLHCPPAQKPLLDAVAIDRMKAGAYLINTARASLVDPQAVLNALESGKLRGFATDVYDREPPETTRLLQHERVISTPHIGGFTDESIERATQIAVRNLLKVLEGSSAEGE